MKKKKEKDFRKSIFYWSEFCLNSKKNKEMHFFQPTMVFLNDEVAQAPRSFSDRHFSELKNSGRANKQPNSDVLRTMFSISNALSRLTNSAGSQNFLQYLYRKIVSRVWVGWQDVTAPKLPYLLCFSALHNQWLIRCCTTLDENLKWGILS